MTRYFTVDQAHRILPEIERLMHRAQAAWKRLPAEGAALGELAESISEIQDFGAQVRDLEEGVVEFPTHYLGRDARLSYRLGERDIRHWRPVDDGTHSAQRIDRRFLENHTGSAVH